MRRAFMFICSLVITAIFIGCQPVTKQVCIDWVDAIKVNGKVYSNNYRQIITDEKIIDKEIDVVKFKVAENINDPEYRLKDGDATFLQPGTKIFSVKGYDKNKVAAVKVGVNWILYIAEGNRDLVTEDKEEYISASKLVVAGINEKKIEIEDKNKIEEIAKILKQNSNISQMPDLNNQKRFSFYFVIKDKDGIGKIATRYYLSYEDINNDGYIEAGNNILKVNNTINKMLTEGL
ncbi:hypothetical protein [Clostridium omnivorum]|uniref:Lipoprotein n=1 Tax=Clostridium omnivorum TaxID=1604902 RepID=A0ABQ5N8S3_9CLOT|nr:hypothetical protein [Clostridium sp. E14]GLC31594.1 hypothetical protein bsdE14_30040 [Clostridium sp. E14]